LLILLWGIRGRGVKFFIKHVESPLKFSGRKNRDSKAIGRKFGGLDRRGEEMQRRPFEEQKLERK
jgi:hypothetical protein